MTASGGSEPSAGGGSGDDPFSWLYRRGETAPTEDAPPVVPPTVETSRPIAASPTPPNPPPAYIVPAPEVTPSPTGPPPPTYQMPAAAYASPSEPPRRRGLLVGVIVGALVLAVIAGAAVAMLWKRSNVILDPAPITSAAPTQPPPSQGPSDKSVHPAKPVASGATADCTAPPATDDAGKAVTYDAGNVLDSALSTAWRCDGSGVGHGLTFAFPAGTTISRVGLVNGYVKTDPKSGAKRYGEYRRITRVVWTFDDGTTITQKLADGTQKVQYISVPPKQTQTLRLSIESSTKPGRSATSRDAVLVSEVSFR